MRHEPNLRDSQKRTTGWNSPYRKPQYNKPVHRVFGSVDEHNCVDCGWPLKATSSAMFAGKTDEGERKFRHAMCPSLSERRILRAEALANS